MSSMQSCSNYMGVLTSNISIPNMKNVGGLSSFILSLRQHARHSSPPWKHFYLSKNHFIHVKNYFIQTAKEKILSSYCVVEARMLLVSFAQFRPHNILLWIFIWNLIIITRWSWFSKQTNNSACYPLEGSCLLSWYRSQWEPRKPKLFAEFLHWRV